MTAGADEVEVEVVGIFEHDVTVGRQERRIPVALLRDSDERDVRIPIGSCEAFAIQIALEQHLVPRPLTHDLALRLLDSLSAKLVRVVVDELSQGQAHATLYLRSSEGEITIDARPGDAIALALRADVSVLVKEEIIRGGGESL